jgi:hypothetical protein
MVAMRALRDEFGEHFVDVFKTIAVDNGTIRDQGFESYAIYPRGVQLAFAIYNQYT